MKIGKLIKDMKWYILFAFSIVSLKVGADYMGYSLWPFQSSNETNTARSSRSVFFFGGNRQQHHK